MGHLPQRKQTNRPFPGRGCRKGRGSEDRGGVGGWKRRAGMSPRRAVPGQEGRAEGNGASLSRGVSEKLKSPRSKTQRTVPGTECSLGSSQPPVLRHFQPSLLLNIQIYKYARTYICMCSIDSEDFPPRVFPHSANSNRTSYINCHQLSNLQDSPFTEFKEK